MVIFFLIIGDLYFCCHRSWCPGIKTNFEEFFVKRRRSARKRLESLGWTFKDSLRISTKNFIKQCCSQPTQYAATSPRIPWLLVLESPNLHFPLRVHNNARVVLKVNHQTFLSLERSSLTNHNRREHFLSQIWFTFFHRAHEHGTDVRRWQTVLATAPSFDRDDVQVLGPSVVSAVHNCANWASVRHSVFSAGSGSSSCSDL